MKKISVFISITLVALIGWYFSKNSFADKPKGEDIRKEVQTLEKENQLHNGDLIFQTSSSGQSKAIQLATRSKYSHCGIIYKDGDNYFVFEAVQPVKSTPLDKWISRGDGGHYVIKRLKNSEEVLTPLILQKMQLEGNKLAGKDYDLTFEWSDDRIYCSELIWKIYKRAVGIEIGKVQRLGDFDLSHAAVKQKMRERYGKNIPLTEPVISPGTIFESDNLMTIVSN